MARIAISDELASKRLFGVPYAGAFNTAWPITQDIGPVRFLSAQDGIGDPPPPPDVDAYVEASLPQYPRGEPETDHALIFAMLRHLDGRLKTKCEYRRAIESYALPAGLLPPSPERDAAAACTSAVYPWGAGRDKFRRDAEERARAEEQARAEAAERARIAALPNHKTLRELGFVGVLLPHGTAPSSWPAWLAADPMFPATEEFRRAGVPHPEGDVYLFRARFGVDFGEAPIAGTPCRFVSDYVPERKPVVKGRPVPFAALGARGCDGAPVTVSRDGRTPEGEKAEEDFVALAKQHADDMAAVTGRDEVLWARWLVQAGRRGFGLRRELIVHNLRRLFPGRWTDARLALLLDQAESGEGAWFSPDELYVSPDEAFERAFFGATLAEDAWRAVLSALVDGRDFVLKDECREALVSAGLATKFSTNEEHEHVARVMRALGFRDGRKSVDGETKRGFVRDER